MKIELRQLLLAAAIVCTGVVSAGEDTLIVVHTDKPKGRVVREIFGSEIKCIDGGQGLMTGLRSSSNEFRPDLMEWIEKLKPEFMRFKFIRNKWNWEDGIGPLANRKDDPGRQKFMG